mmetsp:Transcript_7811/g.14718  ORF Transcript_7811/g.14718 Transcript_7811/m.14718 type:complete len:83 (+) Transcript_7811:2285-2533(+)
MEEDLWRCNEIVTENQNRESEKARAGHFFPGAPFKKNEYYRRNMPKDVCTPSVKGASTLSHSPSFCLTLFTLFNVFMFMFIF